MLQLLRKYPLHVAKLIARTTLYIVAFYVCVFSSTEACWYLKVIVVPAVPYLTQLLFRLPLMSIKPKCFQW